MHTTLHALYSVCAQLVRTSTSSDVAAVNASTTGIDVTVVLTVETALTKYAVCIHMNFASYRIICLAKTSLQLLVLKLLH